MPFLNLTSIKRLVNKLTDLSLRSLCWGVNIVAGCGAIATILSFFGEKWWVLAMMEHFRSQYALILLIGLFVQLVSKNQQIKYCTLVWGITLLINLKFIAPLFVPPHRSVTATTTPQTIRILYSTLNHRSLTSDKAIEYLNKQDTDILFLLEVTPISLSKIQSELTNYRLVAAKPRYNSHGIAWFVPRKTSKPIALKTAAIIHLPPYNHRPYLRATISYNSREIVLLCFHVTSPRNGETIASQQVEFQSLTDWSRTVLKDGKRDLIVVGDFNSTPWFHLFRKMLKNSGLINSQSGFGLQPTWNSNFPKAFRIPIDHCLHSRKLTTIRRFIGQNVDSDHLPLFVELRIN